MYENRDAYICRNHERDLLVIESIHVAGVFTLEHEQTGEQMITEAGSETTIPWLQDIFT